MVSVDMLNFSSVFLASVWDHVVDLRKRVYRKKSGGNDKSLNGGFLYSTDNSDKSLICDLRLSLSLFIL